MARKNRTTKDNVGIVYLMTNELYEREHLYKFGITINPFQRKRVQNNSAPPSYEFYDIVILFSKSYKKIEKQLADSFKDLLVKNKNLKEENRGSKEWIQGEEKEIVDIFKSMLKEFPDTEMCYQGKRITYKDGNFVNQKVPNCRLDLLGILDNDEIKLKENKEKTFKVKDNGILVDGKKMSLSDYIMKIKTRNGKTNQFNGYMYFVYKGYKETLYEMWQSLVKPKKT